MQEFEGKVVIITGSSSGIGRAAALRFANAGASVLIHGQSAERIQETEKLLAKHTDQIAAVRGSVEEEATLRKIVDTAVAKFGRIDVLVNNVGTMKKAGTDVESMENYDFIFNVNLKSVIRLTQLALPYLEKTKGNIVNVSSTSSYMALPENLFYSLTKAALNHYTRNCAVKYAPKGVRVNAIAPGPIITNFMMRYDLADIPQEYMNCEVQEHIVGTCIPMTRFGTADECATVIEFLASERAAFVTGSIYDVDGGISKTNAFAAMVLSNGVQNSCNNNNKSNNNSH